MTSRTAAKLRRGVRGGVFWVTFSSLEKKKCPARWTRAERRMDAVKKNQEQDQKPPSP
ncbi:MAG: hypothetical protein QM741_16385 [Rudaea sp.]|uniref:hypothetical protein n=1 Tax=Rudaea sp. TaxID=2136325 RepID=UPI0039E3C988